MVAIIPDDREGLDAKGRTHHVHDVVDDPIKERPGSQDNKKVEIQYSQVSSYPIERPDHPYRRSVHKRSGRKVLAMVGALIVISFLISAGLLLGLINSGAFGLGGSGDRSTIGMPISVYPVNGSVLNSTEVILIWTLAKNATDYDLVINTIPVFASPMQNVTVSGNNDSLDLADGIYYWSVRALGHDCASNWTATSAFTIVTALDQAVVLSPSEGAAVSNTSQLFAWSSVNHAASYRLQIDNHSDFSSPVIDIAANHNHALVDYHYIDGVVYYCRVMAICDSVFGNWSSVNSFTAAIVLATPALNTPVDDVMVTSKNTTLDWTDVYAASAYRLQVSDSSDFSSLVLNMTTEGSEYNLTGLSENTVYYWKVTAFNDFYHSSWSPIASFYHGFDQFVRTYSWSYLGSSYRILITIDGPTYYQAQQENQNDTNLGSIDYGARVNSADPAVEQVAADIKAIAVSNGFDAENTLNLALAFVQSIPYSYDENTTGYVDYARYPIETLVDYTGDCDCKSILFASLVQTTELGYDAVLLEYIGSATKSGHMAVGVAGAYSNFLHAYNYYTYSGQNYYYCETTATGWTVGLIPSDLSSTIVIQV